MLDNHSMRKKTNELIKKNVLDDPVSLEYFWTQPLSVCKLVCLVQCVDQSCLSANKHMHYSFVTPRLPAVNSEVSWSLSLQDFFAPSTLLNITLERLALMFILCCCRG